MHPLTAFSHLQNGPLAIGTVRGEELMVVLFTVRAALSLEELAVAQLLAARCAHKVLRVPHLTQRRDYLWEEGKPSQILDHHFFLNFALQFVCKTHLSHDAFVTVGAVALCHCAHTDLLQVGGQPTQQVVYGIISFAHGCIGSCTLTAADGLFVLLCFILICAFNRLFLFQRWFYQRY